MNILFLSREYPPNIIGGVGTYMEEISKEIARLGHRVYVITGGNGGKTREEYNRGITIIRTESSGKKPDEIFRNKIEKTLERFEYSYLVAHILGEIVKKYSIDIIESTDARAEGFWYYLWNRHIPLVIKLHTSETLVFKLNHEPVTLDIKLLKRLEEFWLLQADRIVGVTRAIAEISARYYKINNKRIRVIPNPVDVDLFVPCNEGIDPLNILYAGRLEFRKGVHVLLRAIPQILRQVPEASFTLVGADCGMRDYLLQKIKENGCERNIHFIEHLPRHKLVEYYQRCSLAVVPSLWENFPYVCLEAMSCGKPVVASKTGGIAELIEDGIDGVLVRPGSANELAQKVITLLSDEKIRLNLGSKAREKMVNEFSPRAVAEKTLSIYEEVRRNN